MKHIKDNKKHDEEGGGGKNRVEDCFFLNLNRSTYVSLFVAHHFAERSFGEKQLSQIFFVCEKNMRLKKARSYCYSNKIFSDCKTGLLGQH